MVFPLRDKGVATGEFARHFSANRSQGFTQKIQRRQIRRLTVKLNKTLNIDGTVKSRIQSNVSCELMLNTIWM